MPVSVVGAGERRVSVGERRVSVGEWRVGGGERVGADERGGCR